MFRSNSAGPEITHTGTPIDDDPDSLSELRPPSSSNSFGSLPRTRSAGNSFSSLPNGLRRVTKKRKTAWYLQSASVGLVLLFAAFVLVNWWMLSRIQDSAQTRGIKFKFLKANSSTFSIRVRYFFIFI